MKFAFGLLCVLVACGGPAAKVATPEPEPAQAPLKVPIHVDRVGDVRIEHKTEVVKEKRGEIAITQRKEYRRRITVLAVHDGLPTKIRVAYEQHTFSFVVDGVERGSEYPSLHGNTYILERVGDGIDTMKETGTQTEQESELVLADNRTFVRPNRLLEVLASRTWKVGELVELDAASVSGIQGIAGTTSIRLVGYDNQVARIEIHSIHTTGTLLDLKVKLEVDVRDPFYGSVSSTATGADDAMTSTAEARIVVSRAR